MIDTPKQKDGFDFLMFQRLWKILKIIFPRVFSIPTTLFFLLLLLSILEQYVGYKVGLISSHYYKVLGDKDLDAFLTTTLYSTLMVLGMALVLTTKSYVANVLYIVWRQILGHTIHMEYFSGFNYYSLNVLQKNLDNPDQRMTQDIDRLCKSLSTVTVTVIISPFKIGYYTYKTYMGTDWVGPVGVFAFFLLGTVLNKIVMSPLVKFFMEQEKQEGNFRFKHMYIRVNAESVAFYTAGPVELVKTNQALNQLIKIQQTVYNRQFLLDMIQNTYDYMGSIVSYLVIAIPIFDGSYDGIDGSDLSSIISKNSFLCMTLMYSFSQLVDLTSSVVALSGVTHRVSQLLEKIRETQKEWDLQELQVSSSFLNGKELQQPRNGGNQTPPDDDQKALVSSKEEDLYVVRSDSEQVDISFIFNNVTISTPDTEKILVKDLTMKITRGEHLLVMGPSSCGKSSLLRVVRGLWSAKEGSVAHNLPNDPKAVIFLPQKSLLTNGCFYEQIIYPLRLDHNDPPNEAVLSSISDVIDKLLLQGLVHRCGGLMKDPMWNWDDVLSPGEMQRVCFLRVFYHKPQFAFLDESTSAISFELEEFIYQMCIDLGITLVSVGHRRSLMKFHKMFLNIHGDGSWSLKELTDSSGDS